MLFLLGTLKISAAVGVGSGAWAGRCRAARVAAPHGGVSGVPRTSWAGAPRSQSQQHAPCSLGLRRFFRKNFEPGDFDWAAAVLRGLQRRKEGWQGSRGRRPSSAESRRRSVDGRPPRDPVHPSVRRCNPLSTAAAQSKSPGSKFFRKKRLSPREHGACCCDCDRGAPAHDVIGTPDTPPCGAATLAARQRPAPAPDPTPTAAEIFRVPNKKSINFLSDCNELLTANVSFKLQVWMYSFVFRVLDSSPSLSNKTKCLDLIIVYRVLDSSLSLSNKTKNGQCLFQTSSLNILVCFSCVGQFTLPVQLIIFVSSRRYITT